jgi:hypothetical protein
MVVASRLWTMRRASLTMDRLGAPSRVVVVWKKDSRGARKASCMESFQDFIRQVGKCLRCVEDVLVFVAGCCDQLFASDTAKMRGRM